MSDQLEIIEDYQAKIEDALNEHEIPGDLVGALSVYQGVEAGLEALAINPGDAAYPQYQRVLAYCLLRRGNILRQMGKKEEARKLSEREVSAARASGDQLTLARSLMSNGTNLIVSGEVENGLKMIEEARLLFEVGDSFEFKQGLGWYWILRADLGNAGLLGVRSMDVIYAATQALDILSPLENWPGIARAYAARAQAYESSGNEQAAQADQQKQVYYEEKAGSAEGSDPT